MSDPLVVRDVPGLRIGHATDPIARTGCTVLRFDRPALTAVEVRGAAPGTRELDLLAPGRTVQHADAILLTGGSAFGLAAADGVVTALKADGRGYPTPAGPVPIVPAAVIFDLTQGEPVAPGPEDGALAYRVAAPVPDAATGQVGAGTGATFGAILGPERQRTGGVGISQVALDGHTITALAVVNAFGAGADETGGDPRELFLASLPAPVPFGQSTTLVAIVTTLPCDHGMLTRACVAVHDAVARTIVPAHTFADGDVAFASAISSGAISPGDAFRLAIAAELGVERAIRAVTNGPRSDRDIG